VIITGLCYHDEGGLQRHLSKQIGNGFAVVSTTNRFGEHHRHVNDLRERERKEKVPRSRAGMYTIEKKDLLAFYLNFIRILHVFFLRNRVRDDHGFEWRIVYARNSRSTEDAMTADRIDFARTRT
jgi:hypothetical protein